LAHQINELVTSQLVNGWSKAPNYGTKENGFIFLCQVISDLSLCMRAEGIDQNET
jgi:hypothetical protein